MNHKKVYKTPLMFSVILQEDFLSSSTTLDITTDAASYDIDILSKNNVGTWSDLDSDGNF